MKSFTSPVILNVQILGKYEKKIRKQIKDVFRFQGGRGYRLPPRTPLIDNYKKISVCTLFLMVSMSLDQSSAVILQPNQALLHFLTRP